MGIEIKVLENGRMLLPMSVRKRLGLEKGGTVILEANEQEVTLRTVDQTLDKVRSAFARYADVPGSSVDDFLAARRQDSGE